MSDPRLSELIEALTEALRPQLERSAPMRRAARALGEWLIAASAESRDAVVEPTPAAEPVPQAPPPEAPARAAVSPADVNARWGIVPLRIGDATVHVPVAGTTTELGRARQTAQEPVDDGNDDAGAMEPIDLELTERRLRLKAESCRVYLERRAAMGADPWREQELGQRMSAMIAEAKSQPDCFLWVFYRERTPPPDAVIEKIGVAYEALAESVGLVRLVEASADRAVADRLPEAMALTAWASSALLQGMQLTWLRDPDIDQDKVHHWLRTESSRRSIYLPRHMRLDDPADLHESPEILARVRAVRKEIASAQADRARIDQSFKTIRYHARRLGDGRGAIDTHDRQRVMESIDRLLAEGVAPSDVRFAGAIPAALATALTPNAEGGTGAVFRGVAARASRPDIERPEAVEREWSDRVLRVRDLLRGRRVVIIGGEARQDAIERITEAFALEGVEWVSLPEHSSGAPMRAPIQRQETALVLVLIRLSGHLHVDEARERSAAAGKPCVSVPAGYNPEQLAEAILSQASEQLTLTARAG